jgi:hypothetical protein
LGHDGGGGGGDGGENRQKNFFHLKNGFRKGRNCPF